MTAVMELAHDVSEALDAAEEVHYGPSAYWAEKYERRAKIHQMTADGMSAETIGQVVGLTPRNVVKNRSLPVPDNVIPLPPRPAEITDERAAELERAADLVLDLACRLRDENPLLIWDALSRMDRWQLQELMVLLLATVDIDRPKSELFAWVMDLPAAQEESQ